MSAAIGLALSPETVTGDAGRMLAIFLGLVSASILPTISLLVGNMTSSGRSVLALDELKDELDAAMDALFLLFGCVGVAIASLAAMSVEPPDFLVSIPLLTSEILPRFGQMVTMVATTLIVTRAGQIPAILRRTLVVRHRIATDEARTKINDNAPDAEAIKKAFATNPEFGKTVKIEDTQRNTV